MRPLRRRPARPGQRGPRGRAGRLPRRRPPPRPPPRRPSVGRRGDLPPRAPARRSPTTRPPGDLANSCSATRTRVDAHDGVDVDPATPSGPCSRPTTCADWSPSRSTRPSPAGDRTRARRGHRRDDGRPSVTTCAPVLTRRSPSAFAAGASASRRRRGDDRAVPPPTCLYFASGHLGRARARCSPPATTRPSTTASSCAVRGPCRWGWSRGWPTSGTWSIAPAPHDRSPRPARSAEHRPAGGLRRAPAGSLVPFTGTRPLKVVIDAGNGMAGPHRAGRASSRLTPDRFEVVPLYFELDGSVPEPRGEPDRASQPPSTSRTGWSARSVPTSGWPSTAMPTGASSSTSGVPLVDSVRAHRAHRQPASWPRSRAPR